MAAIRVLVGLELLAVAAALAVSGGSPADSVHRRYLPGSNSLRTVVASGDERTVAYTSLGGPARLRWDRGRLARFRPLGDGAPAWARRMYLRSLLVLRALTDRRTGAAIAGARDGWAYVWPRDAMALASAGYRAEARRVMRFLLGLDLKDPARFTPDGVPVEGREAQGDAAGWVAVAARAVGLRYSGLVQPWRDHADYQEREPGSYFANAIATTAAEPKDIPAGWSFGSAAGGKRDLKSIRGGRRARA